MHTYTIRRDIIAPNSILCKIYAKNLVVSKNRLIFASKLHNTYKT